VEDVDAVLEFDDPQPAKVRSIAKEASVVSISVFMSCHKSKAGAETSSNAHPYAQPLEIREYAETVEIKNPSNF